MIDPKSYTYHNGKKVRYIPMSNTQTNFAIVRGLAGSGKTTFANSLGIPVVDIDAKILSIHDNSPKPIKYKTAIDLATKESIQEVEDYLREGVSCAVVSMFIKHDDIAPFLRLARVYRARNVMTFTCMGKFETSMKHLGGRTLHIMEKIFQP